MKCYRRWGLYYCRYNYYPINCNTYVIIYKIEKSDEANLQTVDMYLSIFVHFATTIKYFIIRLYNIIKVDDIIRIVNQIMLNYE